MGTTMQTITLLEMMSFIVATGQQGTTPHAQVREWHAAVNEWLVVNGHRHSFIVLYLGVAIVAHRIRHNLTIDEAVDLMVARGGLVHPPPEAVQMARGVVALYTSRCEDTDEYDSEADEESDSSSSDASS